MSTCPIKNMIRAMQEKPAKAMASKDHGEQAGTEGGRSEAHRRLATEGKPLGNWGS
jgi:hypothetical protein